MRGNFVKNLGNRIVLDAERGLVLYNEPKNKYYKLNFGLDREHYWICDESGHGYHVKQDVMGDLLFGTVEKLLCDEIKNE